MSTQPSNGGSSTRLPADTRARMRAERIAQSSLTDKDGFLEMYYCRSNGESSIQAYTEFIGTDGEHRPFIILGARPNQAMREWIENAKHRIKTQLDAHLSVAVEGDVDRAKAIGARGLDTLITLETERRHLRACQHQGRKFFLRLQVENGRTVNGTADGTAVVNWTMDDGCSLWGDTREGYRIIPGSG